MRNKVLYIVFISFFAFSCTVDNVDDINDNPKTDFSDYHYVLATEDASDVDITTFFSFNWEDVEADTKYDLIGENDIFVNSNPSTSAGQASMGRYLFSQAKDKKGFSSSPGLYRLTLNDKNQMFIESEINVSRDNLFPARQIAIKDENLAYFYNEGKEAHKIQVFDPSNMIVLNSIDLKPAIEEFKPDVQWKDSGGNNLVRTGSLVMHVHQDKLYVSIVFLEAAGFNLIADEEENFYTAVIDVNTNEVEKIITYEGAKTVGFYVSENKATSADDNGNLYFAAWGWNQFNAHFPSQVFRIKDGETEFDDDWKIDIEGEFGAGRIVQSMIAYKDHVYLHVSQEPYGFSEDNPDDSPHMEYYRVDPNFPDQFEQLDIPSSNYSTRMNVFNIVDGKLFIAVPNIDKNEFNGLYAIDENGQPQKEMTIDNKYRPVRLYNLKE